MLPPHLASREESRQRFEVEARAIASLNHPHICAIYDIGQQDGVDYLVMEYLEGVDLKQLLAQVGPLPSREAVGLLLQVIDGLDLTMRAIRLPKDPACRTCGTQT